MPPTASQAELDGLKRKRRFLRKSLTDTLKMIDTDISQNVNFVRLKFLKETIQNKLSELNDIQGSVCSLIEDEAHLDDDCAQHSEYEIKALQYISMLTEYIEKETPRNAERSNLEIQQNISSSSNGVSLHGVSPTIPQVRLPKINLPTFDGDVLSWQPYYQSIKVSVIDNQSLADVQKLEYIMRSLKGKATETVKGYSIIQENYQAVLDTLLARFGNQRLILEAHIKSLLHQSPLTSEDATSMRRFFDKVTSHVRSVNSMGEKFKTEALEPVLVPLIVDKLPKSIVEKWELEMKDDKSDCLSMKTLLLFLEHIIRAKESSSIKSSHSSSSQESKVSSKFEPSKSQPYKSNYPYRSTTSSMAAYVKYQECPVCNNPRHRISSCIQFLSMTVRDRHNNIKSKGLCFRCLEGGHVSENCQAMSCKYCKRRHHHLLHLDYDNSTSESTEVKSTNVTSALTKVGNKQVQSILQTVPCILTGSNLLSKNVRCFFDPGSQSSFVMTPITDELGLNGETVRTTVSGFEGRQGKPVLRKRIPFSLASLSNPKIKIPMTALTTDVICQPAEAVEFHPSNWPHLQDIKFAEEFPRGQCEIDVLIGMDYYYLFVTSDMVKGEPTEPVAVRTKLGWILCGPAVTSEERHSSVSMYIQVSEENVLNSTLEKFWDLESIGIKANDRIDPSEDKIMKDFKNTLTFDSSHYTVSIPWKEDIQLASNYKQAEKRLLNLERKLKFDTKKADIYNDAINKYIEGGFAEEVKPEEIIPPDDGRHTFYLPHHAVFREDKATSKIRIVFDGSAKDTNGVSLNNCIHPGPALQEDLAGILIRFRKHRVAIVGDIQKMFLQVHLADKDKDAHRYLWRDLDVVNPIKTYRMTRVTFGITASPFLAIGTIQEHAKLHQDQFTWASSEIIRNTYVDDIATGADDAKLALTLQQDLKDLMAQGGFNLTKWSSNSLDVLKSIPEGDRAPDGLINLETETEESPSSYFTKTLGLRWDPQNDTLSFKVEIPSTDLPQTKRNVLSKAARVFDPLGLITPFTVRSKIYFQELWSKGLSWDDVLPDDISKKWIDWFDELKELEYLKIPRCYARLPEYQVKEIEVHGFGDASENAYAAVIYLRIVSKSNTISTSLVMSKSRVAPVKKITLPRLELMAAVITARLCKYVCSMLDYDVTRVVCWTDNSSTFHWVKGTASQWKPFVANRVMEIQGIFEPSVFRYCPGKDNPADLPSRGIKVQELMNSQLWWDGPSWLMKSDEEWPAGLKSSSLGPINEAILSEKRKTSLIVCIGQVKEPLIKFERFSRYLKLIRTVAWIKRFIRNLQVKKEDRNLHILSVPEIEAAEDYLLSQVQESSYMEEIELLKVNESPTSNHLSNLNPYFDTSTGFLRVGGRIHKSLLPEEEKHPIILPSSHPVVKLLIAHVHSQELHAGTEHTLSILRQKYWICKGRSTVKQVLNKCLLCRHYYTKPFSQRMAPLPADRIQPSAPFTYVGLYFAGPIHLKDCDKVYICLFTCAVTRAVHLELVTDMSVEKFLLALRRMISRRGMCHTIWSDNAKTFKCANKELQKCWRIVEDSQTQVELANKKIHWKFIVERAPWWGGFYERLVRSIKTPIKKILGKSLLDIESFTTILTEVECQIYSRPLTYVSSDPKEPEVISPAHILIGRPFQPFPSKDTPKAEQTSKAITNRWRYHQRMVNNFWNRWSLEYLKSLNTLKRWTSLGNEIHVGDIVLISEDRVARGQWLRGRVQEIYIGRDNLVRSVLLKTSTGVLRRPVQRLHLLETVDADI